MRTTSERSDQTLQTNRCSLSWSPNHCEALVGWDPKTQGNSSGRISFKTRWGIHQSPHHDRHLWISGRIYQITGPKTSLKKLPTGRSLTGGVSSTYERLLLNNPDHYVTELTTEQEFVW